MDNKKSFLQQSAGMIERKLSSARIHYRSAIMKYKSAGVNPLGSLTHVTVYSAGNVGDTALSECVRQTFSEEADFHSWKLVSVRDPVDSSVIESINRTKGVVIGGGGLFLPDSNKNNLSGWQWAVSNESLSRIRVPIIVYSVGYNNFRGQVDSELFISGVNALVRKASFVGLRNHGSVEHVQALLEPELREKILFQPCTTTLIRKIYPDLPEKKEHRSVAFNIAFDRADRRYGGRQDEILYQIAKAVFSIRDIGYKVYIIGHCFADMDFMRYVKQLQDEKGWSAKGITVVNASAWSCGQIIHFYNSVDCVIGMRGHAQMIPFGVNCHIITLGSHAKMKWFLDDIDCADWYIEITEEVNTLGERITEQFVRVHEVDGGQTTWRLLEKQAELYSVTKNNMKTIKALLRI